MRKTLGLSVLLLLPICMWAATVYLHEKKQNYLITLIPAIFMTAVSATYFLIAPECLHLPAIAAWPMGLTLTGLLFTYSLAKMKKRE